MIAEQIIVEANKWDIKLVAHHGRLLVDSPAGVLNAHWKQTLKHHKTAIVNYLSRHATSLPVSQQQPTVYSARINGKKIPVICPLTHSIETFKQAMVLRFGEECLQDIQLHRVNRVRR